MSTHRRRRWQAPLLIVFVAAALMFWGMQRQTQQSAQVQQHVRRLCDDIAAGKDLSGAINRADPFVDSSVIAALKQVCASPAAAASLEIIIKTGDVADAGSTQGKATHRAVLRVGNVDRLGLRIQHDGDPERIRILGYWLPQNP